MYPMFIEMLFTVGRTWTQPKCQLTEEWITMMWSIYTMEYYSAIRENKMSFAVTWMDLEIVILSEVSQRKTNMILLIYAIQKNGTNKPLIKQK